MHEVTPLSPNHAVIQRMQVSRLEPQAPVGGGYGREDSVEVSAVATLLSRMDELPEIRADLVTDIRDQIALGTYDIEGKIDLILDRVLMDL